MNTTIRNILAFALLALTAAASHAQSIVSQVSSTQAYLNEPLRVVVRASDLGQFEGPSFEPVEGLEIRRLPGDQTSTSMTIVNGRTTQLRTVAMSFEVLPRELGQFTIPAFTVVTDGARLSTKPIAITVVASNSATLMQVRVVGEPRDLYIGQQGSLNLEIMVKRYSDPTLGVTLDEQSTWSLLDPQGSTWGIFGPALQKMAAENRRPRGELRIVDGTEFIVYTISRVFDPIATGVPVVGEVRIRTEYPTGLQRDRSFFLSSGYQLSGSRTLSVTASTVEARVLPLPEGGRPESWNGAVGEFDLFVVAKPHEVSVGDPITLTMRLSDGSATAALDGLQAPVLGTQAAFTSAFRVPSEPASGTVEGRSKVFTQSIRALSDAVTEIPPVEFSYFDPAKGEYRTLRSKPIAIKVKPSAIARLDDGSAAAAADPNKPAFTRVEGGLVANMSVDEARARSTVTVGEFAFGVGLPIAAGFAPFIVSALVRRVTPRDTRRARALRQFEHALAVSLQPESVEAAMLHLIASRLAVSSAGFSRRDALDGLANAGVDAAAIERTEQFLRECERARYLGGAITREQALEVAREIEARTAVVGNAAERSAA